MKSLPRRLQPFTGRADLTPFVAVLFLVLMFVVLSGLVYTPGVRLELPVATNLPGVDLRPVAVAIDSTGRLFFENQMIDTRALGSRLAAQVSTYGTNLVLVIRADRNVPHEKLLGLALLAKDAGIQQILLATMPTPVTRPHD